jgi:DNA-binding XRE family transcriptional regulator
MSVVDWASKPEPWRWIGPQFRRECEVIARSTPLPLPPWRQLAERRKRLGLTQIALGRNAGLAPAAICNAERGELSPNPKHLAALARLEADQR